jgi:hypothetical protein
MNVGNIFFWLNQNQGALVAGCTIVLVLVNIIYAWLNRGLLLESRILRKAQTEPYLTAYIKLNDHMANVVDLIVVNVGQGPAFNVSAKVSNSEQIFAEFKKTWIDRFPLDGYNVIPQGERFNFFLGVGHELLAIGAQLPTFLLKFEYVDLHGKRHASKCELDVRLLEGQDQILNNPLNDISKNLKDISAAFKRAMSGAFGRLQVEYVTKDEALKEMERIVENAKNPPE